MASKTKQILKKQNIRPSKRLGQNFLISQSAVSKVIAAADISKNDVVLEIGPGTGNLTKEIAKIAKKIIAVEKDKKMAEIIKSELKNFENLKIINCDALKYEINKKELGDNYKIVANLPFYITAPIVRKFLESDFSPNKMILIIQKEVAQRICAKPGDTNILAASVQFYSQSKIISYISKSAFYPMPEVDAAIIKIVPHYSDLNKDINFRKKFFKVVKAAFSQPRKQLANNFSNGLKIDKEKAKKWLVKNNIKPEQRAETLPIDDLIILAKSMSNSKTQISNQAQISKSKRKYSFGA